jgi:hypothetical protein
LLHVRTRAAFRRVLKQLHGPPLGWPSLTY